MNNVDAYPSIKSTVKDWLISTVWRKSSAMDGGEYYETMVWGIDAETRTLKNILWQGDGLDSHFDACRKLMRGGIDRLLEDKDE